MKEQLLRKARKAQLHRIRIQYWKDSKRKEAS